MATQQFRSITVARAFSVEVDDVSYLGTGSFGETWAIKANDDVPAAAVKILYKDDYSVDRLEREVGGLGRVLSDYVVRFGSTGSAIFGDRARPYISCEFVEGSSLTAPLRNGNRPSGAEFTGFVQGLLKGCQALHDEQLVHRDIKPDNIILRGGAWNSPVLIDLGLSKFVDETSVTAYPALLGTVPYMAPEQLGSQRARYTADLWAVGVVAAQVWTGAHPYWMPGTDLEEVGALQLQIDRSLFADMPAPTGQVIDKVLSVRRGRRGTARSALEMLGEPAVAGSRDA
ncbi:serine/threonine-protein kinase [Mycobacterium syngnathidarum]